MSKNLPDSTVQSIYNWFKTAVPTVADQNIQSQIGCDLEEMCELLEQLQVDHNDPNYHTNCEALGLALTALMTVSQGLKKNNIVLAKNLSSMRKGKILDAICDRAVTGIGVAYMLGMDPMGALAEVNRSNWSKFDDNGKPIFDPNMKIIKGPNYSIANMNPYLVPPKDIPVEEEAVEDSNVESTEESI